MNKGKKGKIHQGSDSGKLQFSIETKVEEQTTSLACNFCRRNAGGDCSRVERWDGGEQAEGAISEQFAGKLK